MADDANTPVDANTVVDPYSDPIWSQTAVIPTTFRFDTVDTSGDAALFFVEAATEDDARALFAAQPGADPNPTVAVYTPTNLELKIQFDAGGFTMLATG